MNDQKTVTLTLRRQKETTNKVKLATVQTPGQPPILDDVYLHNWWIGDTSEITVTITKANKP